MREYFKCTLGLKEDGLRWLACDELASCGVCCQIVVAEINQCMCAFKMLFIRNATRLGIKIHSMWHAFEGASTNARSQVDTRNECLLL